MKGDMLKPLARNVRRDPRLTTASSRSVRAAPERDSPESSMLEGRKLPFRRFKKPPLIEEHGRNYILIGRK